MKFNLFWFLIIFDLLFFMIGFKLDMTSITAGIFIKIIQSHGYIKIDSWLFNVSFIVFLYLFILNIAFDGVLRSFFFIIIGYIIGYIFENYFAK